MSSGDYHDVPGARQAGLVQSEEFPDESLDSISLDRVSYLFADRDPEPRCTRTIFQRNDDEMFRASPYAPVVNDLKIPAISNSFIFAERKFIHGPRKGATR